MAIFLLVIPQIGRELNDPAPGTHYGPRNAQTAIRIANVKWDLARLDKLSPAALGLVFIAAPFPLWILFVLVGEQSRGALFWAFSSALLNALYAVMGDQKRRVPAAVIVVLLVFHTILIVFWNPLRHFRLLGGLCTPIAIADFVLDYTFIQLVFKLSNGLRHKPVN